MSSSTSRTIQVALAGNPNCGKTALFNALTGSRQQVGNYPGVTVERVEGRAKTPSGRTVTILDLPGAYSLSPRTPDEAVTRDFLMGLQEGELPPDLILAVADATSLERNLAFILELKNTGLPVILALNMMDLAKKRGSVIDLENLSRELGCPIIPTTATKQEGVNELLAAIEAGPYGTKSRGRNVAQVADTAETIHARFAEADRILQNTIKKTASPTLWTDRIDRLVLHPFWGSVFLILVLATMFQAVFNWAEFPMEWLESLVTFLGKAVHAHVPGVLGSLIADGVISGVGSVLVFLPQILLLFLFILVLEDSGYMARAAFLMDKIMGKAGLHGRAFIPLLSSFACAVPGIMAARTIENRKDRFITILVAPLITCSARLPVYSLLIAAFIPNRNFAGPLKLQGAVMFFLYFLSVLSALTIAALLKKTAFRGPRSPLLLELPTYKWPSLHNIFHGLTERALIFIRRAGTVILGLSIILWFLSSYPQPPATPEAALKPPILYSYAGKLGTMIEPAVKPLGFNWQIAVAMIPGLAAREIMIGALGTVYAVEEKESDSQAALAHRISQDWSLATGLSLLVWYVYSCQCISTLAVTRRETNSWRWPLIMFTYMTALAYAASFVVFQALRALGYG